MISERKMGTPARFMATKSVKRDQPTFKATRPEAMGKQSEIGFSADLGWALLPGN
jgi:hypothetical protein